jgi:hypothetical protein
MDDTSETIRLLEEIKNEIRYLQSSMPDFSSIEDLLTAILKELKK